MNQFLKIYLIFLNQFFFFFGRSRSFFEYSLKTVFFLEKNETDNYISGVLNFRSRTSIKALPVILSKAYTHQSNLICKELGYDNFFSYINTYEVKKKKCKYEIIIYEKTAKM